jgi:HSP20 family molecular chaperone IbpA
MAFYSERPTGDFIPLFRLLHDYDAHRSSIEDDRRQAARTFSPKFDVRETNGNYLLDGELPGIAQSDIEIEFADPRTLVIKGRVRREYNHASVEDTAAKPKARPVSPNKPHQPTVEDEGEATGESSAPVAKLSEKQQVSADNDGKSQSLPFAYRVSERQVGEFHRTFAFSTRVDQDAVKANLKNGILSVIIPKAPAYTSKTIRIE